jgi:N-acetylglucosamine-6-sulfatase
MLPRISFLALLLLGSTAIAGAADSLALPRLANAKPRNVVLILSDDHRYDAMGFMGHPFLQTPHLDSIAAGGVHLKNACVTTALCSPSRASILTGLYTHRHRVIDNQRAIPPGTRFFPEYLQAAGYATAFVGKWHMGGESDAPRPGFDHWVSFKGQGTYLPSPAGLNINGKKVEQKGYITDELADYAVDWLKAQRPAEKPFFLFLSHKAVHANFTPALRHAGRYQNAKWRRPASAEDKPESNTGKPRWVRDQRNSWHGIDFPYHSDLDVEQYYKSYCETLLAVDESVGRVLQQLKSMGAHDDTLVIYMGDNGFMFGEHGLIDKRVAYEESIRVPMVMQCPGLFSGGRVVEQVVANIDIAPTILEVAGLAKPRDMDGLSFLPLAQSKTTAWRDYFLYVYYWEKNYPQTPTMFALRGDRYKYITYYGLWDTDELYDLQADRGEQRNLIRQPEHRAIAREMETKLYELMAAEAGMAIPLNAPAGGVSNKRLAPRAGSKAADFPAEMVVPGPINRGAQ